MTGQDSKREMQARTRRMTKEKNWNRKNYHVVPNGSKKNTPFGIRNPIKETTLPAQIQRKQPVVSTA
jgi:hypothetical protein